MILQPTPHLESACWRNKYVKHTHWRASAAAMPTRNTTFTMTMPFVITLNQGNEPSCNAICRPCALIIQASHRVHFADPFEAPVWRSQWVQRIVTSH